MGQHICSLLTLHSRVFVEPFSTSTMRCKALPTAQYSPRSSEMLCIKRIWQLTTKITLPFTLVRTVSCQDHIVTNSMQVRVASSVWKSTSSPVQTIRYTGYNGRELFSGRTVRPWVPTQETHPLVYCGSIQLRRGCHLSRWRNPEWEYIRSAEQTEASLTSWIDDRN